ncbi:MAG TPA: hypothetical protein VF517_17055 [Thermoleophilaceae bacterium]|jgi:hypothetical protein
MARVSRAPRSDGPRTTLRLTPAIVETAERLAGELGVSRNDALLRLAARGAHLYEEERRIAERRDERWAAVVAAGADAGQAGFPSADEAWDAVALAREGFDAPEA